MRGKMCSVVAGLLLALSAGAGADDKAAQGSRAVNEAERKEITPIVADAADRAMSERGLDAVLELVTVTDRERINKDLNKDSYAAYRDAANRIATLWREKYNHNFSAGENIQALQYLGMTTWRDPRGRDRVAVEFPSAAGRSRFTMHLLRDENNLWRIMLPDKLSGENFAEHMTHSLKLLADQSDKLPESRSDGYIFAISQMLHELNIDTQPRSADVGRD